jgi:hypothetical protein
VDTGKTADWQASRPVDLRRLAICSLLAVLIAWQMMIRQLSKAIIQSSEPSKALLAGIYGSYRLSALATSSR